MKYEPFAARSRFSHPQTMVIAVRSQCLVEHETTYLLSKLQYFYGFIVFLRQGVSRIFRVGCGVIYR